mmetsp:Transcript_120858/g.338372  ORF Transcript_120858/g.338372 Transcript_120858/m.338372 type:complete len:301 (-) Transcript_120858:482-1384(-)
MALVQAPGWLLKTCLAVQWTRSLQLASMPSREHIVPHPASVRFGVHPRWWVLQHHSCLSLGHVTCQLSRPALQSNRSLGAAVGGAVVGGAVVGCAVVGAVVASVAGSSLGLAAGVLAGVVAGASAAADVVSAAGGEVLLARVVGGQPIPAWEQHHSLFSGDHDLTISSSDVTLSLFALPALERFTRASVNSWRDRLPSASLSAARRASKVASESVSRWARSSALLTKPSPFSSAAVHSAKTAAAIRASSRPGTQWYLTSELRATTEGRCPPAPASLPLPRPSASSSSETKRLTAADAFCN